MAIDGRGLLVRNEQAKLTATYLNGLAIAIFAVGALAPLVAYISGSIPVGAGAVSALTLSCAATSLILHLLARRSLQALRV